jgi:type II secretory pathway pseudopilin PulG
MDNATKSTNRRVAFTLVELIVVIAIILMISALAAAFVPRVSDSQNLTRAVDSLEQWLLTAKMRAKRDGLATGIRLVQAPTDAAGTFSQCQYIQQPEILTGGTNLGSSNQAKTTAGAFQYPPGSGVYYTGGICINSSNGNPPNPNLAHFVNVDFTGGMPAAAYYLVQPGDYLELGTGTGNVQLITGAITATTLPLSGKQSISQATATTNYRILRQPRVFIGEAPLQLPTNYVVDMGPVPNSAPQITWSNVASSLSNNFDILFAPSGAVIGSNAVNGKVLLCVHEQFEQNQFDPTNPTQFDPTRAGVVAVQTRTGFIGAFSLPVWVPPGPPAGYDPFAFAESGRESGL